MENKGKNRYLNRSHISERKFREILRCFGLDITATKTAELTSVSRPTVNKIYKKIRQRIKQICDYEFPLKGEIEVDESYFGQEGLKVKEAGDHMGRL